MACAGTHTHRHEEETDGNGVVHTVEQHALNCNASAMTDLFSILITTPVEHTDVLTDRARVFGVRIAERKIICFQK